MNLGLQNLSTISKLEQLGLFNLIVLSLGPLLIIYGFIRCHIEKNKRKNSKPTVLTMTILVLGLVTTVIGVLYYRFYS